MKNKFLTLTLCLVLAVMGLAGCGDVEKAPNDEAETITSEDKQKEEAPKVETEKTEDKKNEEINIRIVLEDGRTMEAELYPDVAPISVENFVKLIEEDFFDGLIFHRVIEGFMIQGGGYDETFYDGNLNQKETASIKGEFSANGVKNDLKHTKGVLSMARTQVPDSASSQFFIMHEDSPHLDGQYAAFGKVTKGIEVVDQIATGKTTAVEGTLTYEGQEIKQRMTDVPETPVVIKTIEIIK